MSKLSNDQMTIVEGGRCMPGPGNSEVGCTGLCLAGVIAFINSDGNSANGIDPIAC